MDVTKKVVLFFPIKKKYFFFISALLILLVYLNSMIKNTNMWMKMSSSAMSHVPTANKFHIFIIWKGEKFPIIYQKAFQTLVKFHPKAEIMIFSNELDVEVFRKYNESENVFLVRYDLDLMVKNKLGYDFVSKASRIMKGEVIKNNKNVTLQLTHVHLSDFMRLFLVYYYGGLYLDTDMFVLRNLESFRNSIGVDDHRSYVCSSKTYSTSKVFNFSCLCNCMMSFDKNHAFLKAALEQYDLWWSSHQGYGPGGAIMLTELLGNYLDQVNPVSNDYWVCNKYMNIRYKQVDENYSPLKEVMENCIVLHMYGGGMKDLSLDGFEEKFVGRVYKRILLQ